MKKVLFKIGLVVLIAIFSSGCMFKAPAVKGVVIDKETGKPVEGAWVAAVLVTSSRTIAGSVPYKFYIESMTTGSDGRFEMSRKSYSKPPFPIAIGSWVKDVKIFASAVVQREDGDIYMDKILRVEKEDFQKFKKEGVVVDIESSEGWAFYLRDSMELRSYKGDGRIFHCIGADVPKEKRIEEVNDILIRAYESFLKRYYVDPYAEGVKGRYRVKVQGAHEYLGTLYLQKDDFKRAIEYLSKARDYAQKMGLERTIRDIKRKIERAEKGEKWWEE
jgi:hypothetical protein